MFPVAWLFLLHLHKIFCSKNPLLDFFQTVFTKKSHQWYGYSCKNNGPLGAHQRPKLFQNWRPGSSIGLRDLSTGLKFFSKFKYTKFT